MKCKTRFLPLILIIFVIFIISTQVVSVTSCKCSSTNRQVCGTDGVTYQNSCILGCAAMRNPNLKIKQLGSCRKKSMG